MKKNVAFTFFVSVLLLPSLALAQGLGSIVGIVTDPSGAVVVSAQVKATEQGTGLSRGATTNSEGYYVISALRPAEYTLTIAASGFRTFTERSVNLLADKTLTLNAKLGVGGTTEVFQGSGNPLQVDHPAGARKKYIQHRHIRHLPLHTPPTSTPS